MTRLPLLTGIRDYHATSRHLRCCRRPHHRSRKKSWRWTRMMKELTTQTMTAPWAAWPLHMKIAFFKSFLYYLHMKLHIKKHTLAAAQVPNMLSLSMTPEAEPFPAFPDLPVSETTEATFPLLLDLFSVPREAMSDPTTEPPSLACSASIAG